MTQTGIYLIIKKEYAANQIKQIRLSIFICVALYASQKHHI